MNDIFELRSVLNWAKTIDPNKEYEFVNPNNCLLAQYLKHKGFSYPSIGGWGHAYNNIHGEAIHIGDFKFDRGDDSVMLQYPRTFGGFVERAERKLL